MFAGHFGHGYVGFLQGRGVQGFWSASNACKLYRLAMLQDYIRLPILRDYNGPTIPRNYIGSTMLKDNQWYQKGLLSNTRSAMLRAK